MLEDGEVRIKQLVSLADRDGHAEPVSSWGDGGSGDSDLFEPSVHCVYTVLGRRNELLNLIDIDGD